MGIRASGRGESTKTRIETIKEELQYVEVEICGRGESTKTRIETCRASAYTPSFF